MQKALAVCAFVLLFRGLVSVAQTYSATCGTSNYERTSARDVFSSQSSRFLSLSDSPCQGGCFSAIGQVFRTPKIRTASLFLTGLVFRVDLRNNFRYTVGLRELTTFTNISDSWYANFTEVWSFAAPTTDNRRRDPNNQGYRLVFDPTAQGRPGDNLPPVLEPNTYYLAYIRARNTANGNNQESTIYRSTENSIGGPDPKQGVYTLGFNRRGEIAPLKSLWTLLDGGNYDLSASISVACQCNTTYSPQAATCGEPHIRTWDGLLITYAGEGDVTMLEAPSEGTRYEARFTQHLPDFPASWTTALALQCQTGGSVAEVYSVDEGPYDTSILINKKQMSWLEIGQSHVAEDITVERFGGGRYYVSCMDGSMTLDVAIRRTSYPKKYAWLDALVKVDLERFYKKARGLLGTIDDNLFNDLEYRNGSLAQLTAESVEDRYINHINLTLIHEIQDSWRIPQGHSLFSLAPIVPFGPFSDTKRRLRKLLDDATHPVLDAARMRIARNTCEHYGLTGPFVHSCAFDLAITGSKELASYQREIATKLESGVGQAKHATRLHRRRLFNAKLPSGDCSHLYEEEE
mmetsp:Transcript_32556/g.52750  ORF Transcript_32556/g.52750 Transcript_32556/m.52750 type:complete len:575 (+) Transcript_32556:291-2015(+)